MKNKILKSAKGFTLVETLVAISIFSVSVITVVVVLGQGISNTNYAKTKMVATYLAQEGIEYMRNMRDTYVLYDVTAGAGWTKFLAKIAPGGSTGCIAGSGNAGCYLVIDEINFSQPARPITQITVGTCGTPCPPILFNSSTGNFGYSSGTNSGYVRTIRIQSLSASEIKVFSTVSWTQKSGTYSITFSESLFNWTE